MKHLFTVLVHLIALGSWAGLSSPAWAVKDAIPWPKSCQEAPTTLGLDADIRSFCMEFVPDYFYRLHFVTESHTYKVGENETTYKRPKFSLEGSLFLLGLAEVESGWGGGGANKRHNYWGLHGAKPGTLSKFSSFEGAMAFWFNHMDHGIKGNAEDHPSHPGWPQFLELMTRGKFTSEEVNKSLWSGPKYCRGGGGPHYNVGNEEYCRVEYDGPNPGCPCVDYAGRIMNGPVKQIVSYCLKAYQDEDQKMEAQAKKNPDQVIARPTHKSAVYSDKTVIPADQPLPSPADRLAAVRTVFLSYAMEKCKVTPPPESAELKAIQTVQETSRRISSPSGPVGPCK